MLLLLFQLGRDRYAIDTRQVVEVLPPITAKRIPRAPACVAGLFDYHGASVPLLDLGVLGTGQPAASRLSTRIILVDYPDPRGGTRLLGLLAERVTDTVQRDRSEFHSTGVVLADAPWLGPVASDSRGMLQWIELGQLLDDDLQALLFEQPEPA